MHALYRSDIHVEAYPDANCEMNIESLLYWELDEAMETDIAYDSNRITNKHKLDAVIKWSFRFDLIILYHSLSL